MRHYYKIPLASKTGKLLRKYHHAAQRAALAAERYAARWGARSYIGTYEAFEGGVEYLEFEGVPDDRIWRKVGHEWDADARDFIYQYEPRVRERAGTVTLPKGEHPSNRWDRIYMPRPKVLKNQEGKDVWQFRFLEWYGDEEQYGVTKRDGRRMVPPALRRAIRAERERRALPLVGLEQLADILAMRIIQPEGGKRRTRMVDVETPAFFFVLDYYYVSSPFECVNPDMSEIERGTYVFMEGTARRLMSHPD